MPAGVFFMVSPVSTAGPPGHGPLAGGPAGSRRTPVDFYPIHIMLKTIISAKLCGIEAVPVQIETSVTSGIGIHLVGLADAATREALLRTVTAMQANGYLIPGKKIIINLLPADLHKTGFGYDLPIALGLIAASEQRALPLINDYIVAGELGLDGSVRPVPGAVSIAALAAANDGCRGVILPSENALECADCLGDIDVYGVDSLADAVRILSGEPAEDRLLNANPGWAERECPEKDMVDLADIPGQEAAKRALEIAAAGGHNINIIGPDGSPRSLLAKALPGLLPPMTRVEAEEVSRIYSAAGRHIGHNGFMKTRPFRAPLYEASLAALLGGGAGVLPGEVSLAHRGVLFLDEWGLFPKNMKEALGAVLEDRSVTITRLRSRVTLPARFQLVTASAPCPCGRWGEGEGCTCTESQRRAFLDGMLTSGSRVTERTDIQVFVHRSACGEPAPAAESSADVARRVAAARKVQAERFIGEDITLNGEMNAAQVTRVVYETLPEASVQILDRVVNGLGLRTKAVTPLLRVARTIADLEGEKDVLPKHIAEAASFRYLDRI